MEQKKMIKVAMICHFLNPEVNAFLPHSNRCLYNLVRKIMGEPSKKQRIIDLAPWNTQIIEDFKKRDDIDLYVISAYGAMSQLQCSFKSQGVHYTFVKCDYATFLKRIIRNPRLWMALNPMRPVVRKVVNQINPDIIMMVGAENGYIASTALGFTQYPTYVLTQTIYNNPDRGKFGIVDPHNAYVEKALIKDTPYFAVRNKLHYDLLREMSPQTHIFKFGWPTKGIVLIPSDVQKEFDFVNFAHGMNPSKGFPDVIKALHLVKEKYPNVSLNLVGKYDETVKKDLEDLARECGVIENIAFTQFFPVQNDMFMHIQKAKYAVLPCKMDSVSGTMNQAMQLNLPLIVYRTVGTPSFNKEKQCVLIAEHSSVEDLAAKMIQLLDNPDLAETLKKNAREYQINSAENARLNGARLVENFKAIIAHYHHNTLIPQEQLFSDN